MINSVVDKI